MDWFLILGIIFFSVLIFSFVVYSTTTAKIIKGQEKEIAALRTENMRLKNRLGGRR